MHEPNRERACYYLWRQLHYHRAEILDWVMLAVIAVVVGVLLGWRG